MFKIGDKCLATDGTYSREACEVVGFEENFFGVALVRVTLDFLGQTPADGEAVFYPHELEKV